MARRKVKSNKSSLLSQIIVFIVLIAAVVMLIKISSKPTQVPNTQTSLQKRYSDKDLFAKLKYKKRQFDPNDQQGFGDTGHVSYFTKEAKKELLAYSDSDLVGLKCLPDQIYFNRQGKKYSAIGNEGYYEAISINDPNVLNVIKLIKLNLASGYTLSQFVLCKAEDGRYIVKYNAIESGEESDGYNPGINPIAFYSQIFPNGTIQDAAYIEVDRYVFCRYPLQLTKNNYLYFNCREFPSNVPQNALGSKLYKIDYTTLNYKLISDCDFKNLPDTKCEIISN